MITKVLIYNRAMNVWTPKVTSKEPNNKSKCIDSGKDQEVLMNRSKSKDNCYLRMSLNKSQTNGRKYLHITEQVCQEHCKEIWLRKCKP
jgi:hypothetical protein